MTARMDGGHSTSNDGLLSPSAVPPISSRRQFGRRPTSLGSEWQLTRLRPTGALANGESFRCRRILRIERRPLTLLTSRRRQLIDTWKSGVPNHIFKVQCGSRESVVPRMACIPRERKVKAVARSSPLLVEPSLHRRRRQASRGRHLEQKGSIDGLTGRERLVDVKTRPRPWRRTRLREGSTIACLRSSGECKYDTCIMRKYNVGCGPPLKGEYISFLSKWIHCQCRCKQPDGQPNGRLDHTDGDDHRARDGLVSAGY